MVREIILIASVFVGASDQTSEQFMEVEEVRAYQLSEADQVELKKLRDEAAAIAKEAADLRAKARTPTITGEPRDDRRDLQGKAARRESDAKKANVRADRAEKELVASYWLLGWNGERDVMVWVPHDQTKKIGAVAAGDCIEFKGAMIERGVADGVDWISFSADRWEECSSATPPDFKADRPEGQRRIWEPIRTVNAKGEVVMKPSEHPRRVGTSR